MIERLFTVYFLGGPWDLTKKMMTEKALFAAGRTFVVRHPLQRVHTEYRKNEAVAVFHEVREYQYELQQIGADVFIAVSTWDIIR